MKGEKKTNKKHSRLVVGEGREAAKGGCILSAGAGWAGDSEYGSSAAKPSAGWGRDLRLLGTNDIYHAGYRF